MGSMFGRVFTESGHNVSVIDTKAGPASWSAVSNCEVVLMAVPLPVFDEVMARIGPHTREDGVVIDIASLKEEPINSMQRHARGEVIGCHPLFGPATGSLTNQIVFLCPARSNHWLDWFRTFLQGRGCRTVEMEPRRHDRLMSRVQVLRHLFIFCFGRSLMRLDFDIESEAPLSGPWFSELLGMLTRQLEQGPDLYADLALNNPDAAQVFSEFFKAADEVAESFSSRDRQKIIGLINEVSSYLQQPSLVSEYSG